MSAESWAMAGLGAAFTLGLFLEICFFVLKWRARRRAEEFADLRRQVSELREELRRVERVALSRLVA